MALPSVWGFRGGSAFSVGLRGWLRLQCGGSGDGSAFSVGVEGMAPTVWGLRGWLLQCGG